MSRLVCDPNRGGCGYGVRPDKFSKNKRDKNQQCPRCKEVHSVVDYWDSSLFEKDLQKHQKDVTRLELEMWTPQNN